MVRQTNHCDTHTRLASLVIGTLPVPYSHTYDVATKASRRFNTLAATCCGQVCSIRAVKPLTRLPNAELIMPRRGGGEHI